ncbi:MAG: ABC transporter permease [Spirochaetales bacterium]|nr:ABC transporter permease [Spirochaetales bacterium]
MNITEGIRQSFDVISGNKIRSFLTMLGINFGVGCLIAISIVGLAFRDSINSEMGQYGSTLLWVQPDWHAYASGEQRTLLTKRDLAYFNSALPGIVGSGTIFDNTSSVSYKGNSTYTTIMGVDPAHFELFAVKIEKGRNFMEDDITHRRNVCIIRPDIESTLFSDEVTSTMSSGSDSDSGSGSVPTSEKGSDSSLGKIIRVGDRNFTVIGVTERMGQGFLSDGSDNNTVFIPQNLLASRIWGGPDIKYWVYLMKFDTPENVDLAEERILHYLDGKYGKIREEDRFRVERMDSYIGMVDKVLNIVSILILVIAVISIVVGGLGIMNIMLVAVTERTREIGVRMAVGARARDILSQFVIEAITLCLLGGGTGILFGSGLAAIACSILDWKFMISATIILGALSISTIIGLIFGIYPAYQASKLMPIDALRSDI